ncbi:isopentenyl-diphosphate Delta-isomerase 1-like protein [Euroglyphus maynei]|uniref:isopentenyl-diphosphate Delta-isomerase n=1 Tax=Euroglyphus maynei TaxID=6958 RepID=A0A1Y3BTF2_EURMA|nr:isopentenyl-diphosphate Delta-isomerase 1-like protein [Euroglyphus maynei]
MPNLSISLNKSTTRKVSIHFIDHKSAWPTMTTLTIALRIRSLSCCCTHNQWSILNMMSTKSSNVRLDRYDQGQVELLNEKCILVDENDQVVGSESKKACHLMANINKGLLHRAFSVLIFNSNNEFLLTQRSDKKITFPGYYTNTCCSHPLYTPLEMEQADAIGVKRAAQRRLHLELGINPLEIPLSEMKFMTRFLYKAPSNDVWGEHEIDYAVIIHRDVTINPDPDEVKSYRFVGRSELLPFLDAESEKGSPTTPWFRIMLEKFFFNWWDNLDNLDQFVEPDKLYKL